MAKMMSKKEFEQFFKEEVLPDVVAMYEQDGVPDKPARREAWNNTVDAYVGDFLPQAAGNWSHPKWLETLKVKPTFKRREGNPRRRKKGGSKKKSASRASGRSQNPWETRESVPFTSKTDAQNFADFISKNNDVKNVSLFKHGDDGWRVRWAKQTKRRGRNPSNIDSDAEIMLAELVLIAVNDGDAYRDNKNAKRAVTSAFRTYKEYQDDNRRETFKEIESHAIKEVRRRWRTENPTRGSSTKRSSRTRNSHDVDKSTRYFKSALEAADRYLGTAVEQAEKGKLGESVQHLLYAAFWTGQARAEEQYADWQLIDPSQQQRLDEIEKGLKNWGRDTENWVKAR